MGSLFWRLLILSPLLLLVVLFALSNTETARLTLWPTNLLIAAPLSLLMLVAMGVAFLLGALSTWVVRLGARLRARRAEQAIVALRAELQVAQARLHGRGPPPGTTSLPPASVATP